MTSSSEPAPIPQGIQRLLRLASVDGSFREELVRRPLEVAEIAGIPLTTTERAVLAALRSEQLREMAEMLPPPPKPRRDRLRRTAATAVVLLGGAALAGSLGGCPNRGAAGGAGGETPSPPPPATEDWDTALTDPNQPDDDSAETGMEDPPVRISTLPAIGGARSDMPPGDCE